MFEHMNEISQLDYVSKIPLHYQAEEQLRKLIRLPQFSNGELFPKETDLGLVMGDIKKYTS
jgi:GntR family transcriptional regulator